MENDPPNQDNKESLKQKIAKLAKEVPVDSSNQEARVAAEIYYQLEDDLEEALDTLAKLHIVGNYTSAKYFQDIARAERIKDPMHKAERFMKIYGQIREDVAYFIGRRISEIDEKELGPSAKLALYKALGERFLEDYEDSLDKIRIFTNGESLKERIEKLAKEQPADTDMQKARAAAESYFELLEGKEGAMQNLVELGVISLAQKDNYLYHTELYKMIRKLPWMRGGRLTEEYRKIREDVAYFIGRMLLKSDDIDFRKETYIVPGEDFLKAYELSEKAIPNSNMTYSEDRILRAKRLFSQARIARENGKYKKAERLALQVIDDMTLRKWEHDLREKPSRHHSVLKGGTPPATSFLEEMYEKTPGWDFFK